VERKKRIIIALIIAAVIVSAAFYLAERSAQKLDQARQKGLADIQTALDEDKNCVAVLPEIEAYLSKRPADVDIWHAKGICEFESGKYEEAKKSFEQVLVLDPESKSAKNYLKAIGDDPSNYFDIDNSKISREDFESRLEGSIDANRFNFLKAVVAPPPPNADLLEFIIANYESMASVRITADYFEDFLERNGYELSGTSDMFENQIFISGTKDKKTWTFSIWKETSPVQITLTYVLSK